MTKELLNDLINNSQKKHWDVISVTIDDLKQFNVISETLVFEGIVNDLSEIPENIEHEHCYVLKSDNCPYIKKDNDTLIKILPNPINLNDIGGSH